MQFTSDVCDRNKTNCHTSASVKSEIHASNDLICEMICELNLQVMIMTNQVKHQKLKLKICGRGLNASRSPPYPPSKKVAIPDHSREGFEEID